MANMSYCRFHNTNLDLEDCLEALRYEGELSKAEHMEFKVMFSNIIQFLFDEDIIRDDDGELDERLEDYFNSIGIKE